MLITGCVSIPEGAIAVDDPGDVPTIQQKYAERINETKIGMSFADLQKIWPELVKSDETDAYTVYKFSYSQKYYRNSDYKHAANTAFMWTFAESVPSDTFRQYLYFCISKADNTLLQYNDSGNFSATTQKVVARPGVPSSLEPAVDKLGNLIAGQLPEKSIVAVLSVYSDNVDIAQYALDELQYQLVSDKDFKVVDRQNISAIQKEQNFQLSGAVSDETAVSLGKFLGANIVITGVVSGTGASRRISAKAIDVETAEIVTMGRESF
jgi:hypothetical protein